MTEERTITFNGMTGRYDVPSFILSVNSDLRITIDLSPFRAAGLYRVTAIHGGAPAYVFTITAKENDIVLPAEWLNRGGVEMLELSLKQYNAAGTVLINGGYCIEPLEIVAVAGEYRATALLQASFENVERMEKEWQEKFEELKGSIASSLTGYEESNETTNRAHVENIEGYKGQIESALIAYQADTEKVLQTYREDLQATTGEFAAHMEAMDAKLDKVLSELEAEKGVKEEILAKMRDYVDNGIEVPFEEEKI